MKLKICLLFVLCMSAVALHASEGGSEAKVYNVVGGVGSVCVDGELVPLKDFMGQFEATTLLRIYGTDEAKGTTNAVFRHNGQEVEVRGFYIAELKRIQNRKAQREQQAHVRSEFGKEVGHNAFVGFVASALSACLSHSKAQEWLDKLEKRREEALRRASPAELIGMRHKGGEVLQGIEVARVFADRQWLGHTVITIPAATFLVDAVVRTIRSHKPTLYGKVSHGTAEAFGSAFVSLFSVLALKGASSLGLCEYHLGEDGVSLKKNGLYTVVYTGLRTALSAGMTNGFTEPSRAHWGRGEKRR